jgi:dipeptidyl aminopeptidase/acylaminoacyl peptidase
LAPFAVAAQRAAVRALPSFGEPGLSPDGNSIAFVTGGDIWEVPASGGDAHILVSHPALDSRPLFAPDGKRIAFTSTRTGGGDVYVLSLDTNDPAPAHVRRCERPCDGMVAGQPVRVLLDRQP